MLSPRFFVFSPPRFSMMLRRTPLPVFADAAAFAADFRRFLPPLPPFATIIFLFDRARLMLSRRQRRFSPFRWLPLFAAAAAIIFAAAACRHAADIFERFADAAAATPRQRLRAAIFSAFIAATPFSRCHAMMPRRDDTLPPAVFAAVAAMPRCLRMPLLMPRASRVVDADFATPASPQMPPFRRPLMLYAPPFVSPPPAAASRHFSF
jgi:hypothetical protein